MSEEQASYNKVVKAKKSQTTSNRRPKKLMVVSAEDNNRLKLIAKKAAEMRNKKDISSEDFAQRSGISRNSYYRFEKSAESGSNYTVSLLLKVISSLGSNPAEFFKDIQ